MSKPVYLCFLLKKEDMDALLNYINGLVITKCECSGHLQHYLPLKKFKHRKKDGSIKVVSDHIINACKHLNVHIAILFTMMLRHGLSPDGMLHGTMVPITNGRWANVQIHTLEMFYFINIVQHFMVVQYFHF